MNKRTLVSSMTLMGFLSLTIILVGCSGQKNNQSSNPKSADKSISEKITQKKDNVVSGIKEALQNGKTMKCTATTDDVDGVTYIQGKNVKSIVKTEAMIMNVLVKNGDTYVWQDGNTQGQKTSKKCMEELDKTFEDNTGIVNNNTNQLDEEEIVQQAEGGLLHCQPVSGIKFEVPKNIKFVDQCEEMKKLNERVKQQTKQIKGAMPNQADIQKMQEQIPAQIPGMPN